LAEPNLSKAEARKAAAKDGVKFVVTFKAKNGHQWEDYNTSDKSIHINDKNGPCLHMFRGRSYVFSVNQDDSKNMMHLILTNNPAGGVGSKIIPGGFSPLAKGSVIFRVDANTPRYFYYHDQEHSHAGGLITVHDV
jgi:hypothetical protein